MFPSKIFVPAGEARSCRRTVHPLQRGNDGVLTDRLTNERYPGQRDYMGTCSERLFPALPADFGISEKRGMPSQKTAMRDGERPFAAEYANIRYRGLGEKEVRSRSHGAWTKPLVRQGRPLRAHRAALA